MSPAAIHELGLAFGRYSVKRIGIGAGLGGLTGAMLYGMGLFGAHPLFWGGLHLFTSVIWSMFYSQLVGMAQIAARYVFYCYHASTACVCLCVCSIRNRSCFV
jgi:hypothetical protein